MENVLPVMRPQLPTAEELLPYLKRIDEARYYSNHGQLLREFENELATHFGVAPTHISVVANGTVALSAALLAVGARAGKKCLVPSWTFVASASAIWAANLEPHFIDVSPETWMPDPEAIKRRADLDDVGAVMVVSPFGSPVNTRAWDDFTEETGIPAIIDGAAAFDTVKSAPEARPGKTPIMVSLHATKVLGVGEGGVVISTDEPTMRRFRQTCNFGVWGSPEGQILGYNGKLSEYHAAVGLAALSRWPERRALIDALTRRYIERLAALDTIELLPRYGDGWVSCYCNVVLQHDCAPVIERLFELGIGTRRWWQQGVHQQRAYKPFSRDELSVTEWLGKRVFGLPFFHDMTAAQLDRVVSSLKASMPIAPSIA